MNKSVFIDTAYLIALINKDDKYHNIAINFSKDISAEKINLISTELVLIETANFLTRSKFRVQFPFYLKKVRNGTLIEKIIDENLELAWSMYEKFSDKQWSMIDCYSFIVMKKYDIKQALTTDKHFDQAGFERLLK